MAAHRQHLVTPFVAVYFHVVADAVGREQAVNAARVEAALGGQPIQHLIGVVEQALGLFPTTSSSRMRGYLPASDQVMKNGVQSM